MHECKPWLEAWVMRRRDDVSERVFSFGVTAPEDARYDGTVVDGRGLDWLTSELDWRTFGTHRSRQSST